MARMNVAARNTNVTHEGGPAAMISVEKQLRRSVLACMLWESEFYEDGQLIADRIRALVPQVQPLSKVAALAVEARNEQNLRHVPLLLLNELTKHSRGSSLVSDTLVQIIQRADELAEFLAIYTGGGDRRQAKPGQGRTISAQVRKGLARALARFDEYQLAKYDQDGKVKLKDVLRIVRAKPANEAQAALWRRALDRELAVPDTWEVNLSRGADKKETFERLLRDGKLGYMALLRNLRNMVQSGVDHDLIVTALRERRGSHRVLPFRYTAAARAVPQLERHIDAALLDSLKEQSRFSGKTVVLVDVSGSMSYKLSGKSDLTRMDAAATLAAIFPGDVRLFTFSNLLVEVPPRQGMAGVDAIVKSQEHGGTYLGSALDKLQIEAPADRLIVITDEQSHDRVPDPQYARAYMINVASSQNGVGYGRWTHIDGFSEAVLKYIFTLEAERWA